MAASLRRFLQGAAVTDEPAHAGVVMRPLDDTERAAICGTLEK